MHAQGAQPLTLPDAIGITSSSSSSSIAAESGLLEGGVGSLPEACASRDVLVAFLRAVLDWAMALLLALVPNLFGGDAAPALGACFEVDATGDTEPPDTVEGGEGTEPPVLV